MIAVRQQLLQGAESIARQTRDYLPAEGFVYLIDKAIVPSAQDVGRLEKFLPIVVSVDSAGAVCEFPEHTRKLAVGAVACFRGCAVLGWMKGTLRLKFGSRVVYYSGIQDARNV